MFNQIGKCGCDCVNCPTYKENIKTIDDRKKCSAGWGKYLNIKLSPEKLKACDGCSIPDGERKTYYLNCRIRKCAIINNIENCAYCAGFPCDELLKAHSLQQVGNREEFIKKSGKEISGTDYQLFIEPYSGINHLNKIRETLSEKDIKGFKKFSSKIKFVPFPQIKEKQENLKIIYSIITSVCIEKDIPYARLQTLEKRREQLLKILWVIFSYGTFNQASGSLELDAKTFLSQKILGMYNTLLDYLKVLKEFDIHGEIIPLKEKGWQTPTGGLKKEGWIIRLTFGDSSGGGKIIKVLKDYVNRLNAKFGQKAFRVFSTADLSIMLNY